MNGNLRNVFTRIDFHKVQWPIDELLSEKATHRAAISQWAIDFFKVITAIF